MSLVLFRLGSKGVYYVLSQYACGIGIKLFNVGNFIKRLPFKLSLVVDSAAFFHDITGDRSRFFYSDIIFCNCKFCIGSYAVRIKYSERLLNCLSGKDLTTYISVSVFIGFQFEFFSCGLAYICIAVFEVRKLYDIVRNPHFILYRCSLIIGMCTFHMQNKGTLKPCLYFLSDTLWRE